MLQCVPLVRICTAMDTWMPVRLLAQRAMPVLTAQGADMVRSTALKALYVATGLLLPQVRRLPMEMGHTAMEMGHVAMQLYPRFRLLPILVGGLRNLGRMLSWSTRMRRMVVLTDPRMMGALLRAQLVQLQ